MNVSQLRIDVRDKLSAGSGQNTTLSNDIFWSDSEIITYINQGYRKVTNAMRRARAEYFVRTMRSDDSPLAIMGKTYDPSSFAMAEGVGLYNLPPDLIRIVGLYDGRDQDKIIFMGSSIVKEEMKSIFSDNSNIMSGTIIYDIIGSNSLLVRPKPKENFDTILIYERVLEPLTEYTVGTVTVTNGVATASFTGADLANRFNIGDEIIVGSSTDPPSIQNDETYSVIKSIDVGGGMVTFEAPYMFTSQTNAKYIRANVPNVVFNHRDAIAYYATYRGFSKGTNPNVESANIYLNDLREALRDIIDNLEVRHYQDPEFADAYLEDVYD